MTKHNQTMRALRNQPTKWIKQSAENPNQYMTRFNVLMHYVVLRERGVV